MPERRPLLVFFIVFLRDDDEDDPESPSSFKLRPPPPLPDFERLSIHFSNISLRSDFLAFSADSEANRRPAGLLRIVENAAARPPLLSIIS